MPNFKFCAHIECRKSKYEQNFNQSQNTVKFFFTKTPFIPLKTFSPLHLLQHALHPPQLHQMLKSKNYPIVQRLLHFR